MGGGGGGCFLLLNVSYFPLTLKIKVQVSQLHDMTRSMKWGHRSVTHTCLKLLQCSLANIIFNQITLFGVLSF